MNNDKINKEPETKEPEVKEPEVKEPESKEPETKEPEVKEPEVKDENSEKEMKKLKAALDKATKEAAENKRKLREFMTEEQKKKEDEEEQAERQRQLEEEIHELRKRAAVADTSKRIISFVTDEKVANSIAEALYGAEDVDLVIDEIQRAWSAREKRLKQEYGKLPAPGVGDDGAPPITKEELRSMSYKDRVDFAKKYPETYGKLIH